MTQSQRSRKPNSIRTQILLSVNLILGISLIGLLIFQYVREMDNAIHEKCASLDGGEARRLDRIQKKLEQLEKDRAALRRWSTKLRRAFHAMEKLQAKVTRIERDIARLEQS